MFFFDVDPVSDQDLQEYTEEWGVEYPVININNSLPEYPVEGFPSLFFICSDKSFTESGGYGNMYSQVGAQYYFQSCNGVDLSNNLVLYSSSVANKGSICNSSPFFYRPKITTVLSTQTQDALLDKNYQIEIFKNGTLIRTDSIDPMDDGSISLSDEPT